MGCSKVYLALALILYSTYVIRGGKMACSSCRKVYLALLTLILYSTYVIRATTTPEPTTEPSTPEPSTPEPTTEPRKEPTSEPKGEPEKPKPEPKSEKPTAEEIANYATLGVLLAIFVATTIVFGVLWWKVKQRLRTIQTQNQLPHKPGLTV